MNDAWQSTSRILSDWWQSKPRRLEASAFLRDILALSELCPNVQIEWQRQFNIPCSALIVIWRFIKDFIKRQVLPTLSRCADSKCLTTSPYAGGLDISHARQASEIEAGGRCNFVLPTLKVATFNPGRLGLTSFCNQVLEWRLWDIASTLFDLDVGICFLPGARFPEGAQLPNDFPFVFVGERSPSWDSVGALVRIEAMHAVTVDESRSSSRVLFLNVMHEADNTVSHLCGFYAGPGGDLQTWTVIIEAMQELRSLHSDRVIAAFGDGNVHFSDAVQHVHGCRCCHCHQTRSDKHIEALIKASGFSACLPPGPTHESGSVIDFVISSVPVSAHVLPHRTARSDHHLVWSVIPKPVQACYADGLSRVMWLNDDSWDEAIRTIEPLLADLANAVIPLANSSSVAPSSLGGCAPKHVRKRILDAAAWARDFLFVFVGHCCGCIKVKIARPSPIGDSPTLCPDSFGSYEDFQVAVKSLVSSRNSSRLFHFAELQRQSPAAAQQFVSDFLNKHNGFEIALVDPDSNEPLGVAQTIETLQTDLEDRANNDFPQSEEERDEVQIQISSLRHNGGFFPQNAVSVISGAAKVEFVPYTMDELEIVLNSLVSKKKCFRGSPAALKAESVGAKCLHLALVNLSFRMGLTSSLWALRVFTHIRKKGPRIVRSPHNLRPISFGSDCAQLQDALWVLRNKPLILDFCGPCQTAGVSDPASAVIALVLLCQLRASHSLPTYLCFLDLKFAFDVASIPHMLLNCARAGISGHSWLLMDDILASDTQSILFAGFMSQSFQLAAGTAQGRRFSSFIFNALVKDLADIVNARLPGKVHADLPLFAADLLLEAHHARPADSIDSFALPSSRFSSAVRDLQVAARSERSHGPRTRAALRQLLPALSHAADRFALLETLGEHGFSCIQYSDDCTVPCNSLGSVTRILSPQLGSACNSYARKVKAAFNLTRGKTGCMAMMGSPSVDADTIMGFTVNTHETLGFLLDAELSFKPMLDKLVAMSSKVFDALLVALVNGGFPLPIIAAEVSSRVVPIFLYRAPLIVVVDGFELSLNRLQASWGCALLGAHRQARARFSLITTQLGWKRLGSQVIEAAIVALARLRCLPPSHPGAIMLRAAVLLGTSSWVQSIRDIMARVSAGQLGEIVDYHALGSLIPAAQACPDARRALLRRYKLEFVRPILLQYDDHAFRKAAAAPLVGLGIPFLGFLTPSPSSLNLVSGLWLGHETWKWYRCWCFARSCGKWPLAFDTPVSLTSCPRCQETQDVTIRHVLATCSQEPFWAHLVQQDIAPLQSGNVDVFMQRIFSFDADLSIMGSRVEFVGRTILAVADQLSASHS